ncbi:MAG: ComF family protein [Gemmatimonadaceae bacterium]|nr:ComF family protein [Gloeobacterales cyanobacterium ES-bin-141]
MCSRPATALVCPKCEADVASQPYSSAVITSVGLRVYVWGTYRDRLRRLLELLKYAREPALGDWLGERVGRWWLNRGYPRHGYWVAAVPIHPERRQERGYNQAERIARGFSDRTGLPFYDCLARARATPALHGLNPEQRQLTLHGAFKLIRPVNQRSILLVDDILTTGSTLRACATELERSNCTSVEAVVVARPAFNRSDR